MIALVKAVPPQQYEAWLNEQQRMINQANDQVGSLRQYLQQTGQL
jgi:heme/copper-type cytochrome/quinol oxidase subunit 2